MNKRYSELKNFSTFEDRFNYLKMPGVIGEETFGFDRVFNQKFYLSWEWREIRNYVIARDNGCDLGVRGYEIPDGVLIFIHHIMPISMDDIKNNSDKLLNPDNLISCTQLTHNAIHYGDLLQSSREPVVRTKNDTCPWKK